MNALSWVGGKKVIRDLNAEELSIRAKQSTLRDLTPSEFEWLLAYTGLGDVWDGMAAAMKGAADEPSKLMRATLAENRRASFFRLDETLRVVPQFVDFAATLFPDVDLTKKAITAAWELTIGRKTE